MLPYVCDDSFECYRFKALLQCAPGIVLSNGFLRKTFEVAESVAFELRTKNFLLLLLLSEKLS